MSSYFSQDHRQSGKTRMLVRNIDQIRYIVVANEQEALLLENSLIKQHKPKYNINLKDDKSYPVITIRNEAFPRIYPMRNPVADGSEYYGPYGSVVAVKSLLQLIKQLYPLRTCSLNLSEQNIQAGKFKACLEYQIGNCKAPCIGVQSRNDYDDSVKQIRQIIRGRTRELITQLKKKMSDLADEYRFEEAQEIKDRLEHIEKFRSKSVVVNMDMEDLDVFSIASDDKYAYINYLHVSDGAVVQAYTMEVQKKLDETDAELLSIAIWDLRQSFGSQANEVIVPVVPDTEMDGVRFTVPKVGDKKKLLELSETNVRFYMKDKLKQLSVKDPERHTKRILEQMKKDLRMQVEPDHIECFDNSNFQGAYPVSAMVCFKDARPSKKDYRIFHVKTVEGPDDFATMEEVIYRRYKRVLEQEEELPKLIIIDGGKGQLGAALNSLKKLDLVGKVTVIGIAKRLEEIYYPGDSDPMYIDKRSETLKIIQQLRNEAHRFGIGHYRKRHEKGLISTELTNIEGVGAKTAEELLRHFKSVQRIISAGKKELEDVVGLNRAEIVYRYFHPEDTV